MIAPRDLIRSSNKSGYKGVRKVGGQPSRGGSVTYYQAECMAKDGTKWHGPGRRSAHSAAADYCEFVNAGKAAPPKRRNRSAGHQRPQRSQQRLPDEVQAALGVLRDHRAQRAGVQGYVYLIIEVLPGGGLEYGKVGYSTNPKKRAAELQTGNPRILRLHATKKGTELDERALHAKYARMNVLQEWFLITKELLLEFDLNADGVPWDAAATKEASTT